jgi:hypothetical protein
MPQTPRKLIRPPDSLNLKLLSNILENIPESNCTGFPKNLVGFLNKYRQNFDLPKIKLPRKYSVQDIADILEYNSLVINSCGFLWNTVIAYWGRCPVGAFTYYVENSLVRENGFYVNKWTRKKSIASMMFEAACKEFKEKGYKTVFIGGEGNISTLGRKFAKSLIDHYQEAIENLEEDDKFLCFDVNLNKFNGRYDFSEFKF